MSLQFQIKRGLESAIPALANGEMYFATDTGVLHIGNGGNTTVKANIGPGASITEAQVTGLVADLAAKQPLADKDAANGYAGLTSGSLLKAAEFPAFTGDVSKPSGGVATTVVALQGVGVDSTTPADQQLLRFNASSGKWEPVTLGTTVGSFFLDTAASDIGGYHSLINTFPAVGETSLSATGVNTDGEVLIGAFATSPGSPAVVLFPMGQWMPDFFADVNSIAQNPSVVIRVYKRNLAGTETQLWTKTIALTSTSVTEYQPSIEQGAFSLLSTDRLVAKFFLLAGGASSRTVNLYFDGSTHTSHFHIPASTLNIIRAQSISHVSHEWLDSYDASTGTFTQSQPASSDLSDSTSLVTLTGTQTLTNKRVTQRVVALADATSFTLSADTADMNTQANTQSTGTLTANAPSGTPTDGQKLIFRIKSTNVQTYAWDGIFRGSTSVALPTASTGGGKTDYLGFIYNNADSKWDLVAYDAGH